MNQYLSTHLPTKQSLPEWKGIHPAKFQGGRFHQNHPQDQLDNLLTGCAQTSKDNEGKKQFGAKRSDSQNEFKVHMKTFGVKYQKSTIFDTENIKTLIKIPPQQNENAKMYKSPQFQRNHFQTIGTSKIKALFNGSKSTGIYRNFYKSQSKSTNAFQGVY